MNKGTCKLTADEIAKIFERAWGLKPGTLSKDAPYKEGVFKGPSFDIISKAKYK